MRGRSVKRWRLVFEILSEQVMRDAGGYDDTLREPELTATPDGLGTTKHTEATRAVTVRGQVTSGDLFFRQQQEGGGDSPRAALVVEVHKRDLARVHLLGPNQESRIQLNDKLVRVEDRQGRTVWQAGDSPGMYVDEIDPFVSGTDVILYKLSPRTETVKA